LFNFKLGGMAAGAAFVLSFLIGIISGVGIAVVLLKALIFAAVFFALSCLVLWLISQFLPELLNPGEDELGFPISGSKVDISLGDEQIPGAFPTDNSELVDDIAGRPATPAKSAALPLDQGENAEYNGEKGIEDDLGVLESPDFAPEGMMGEVGAEALPDMDGLAETESEDVTDEVAAADIDFESSESRRSSSSSKKPGMAGDFNPKELAQAIQTVLKKDDKG